MVVCHAALHGVDLPATLLPMTGMVMPLYPADIFPHPSAVQEQGGPLIQYWRFSIGGVVISRAAPEMQTDWQLSFKSGSLCLRHPPCCVDPANRHFMHDPAFFL